MTVPPVDVDGFWREGYTVVRGVYSTDDIARFRAAVKQAKAEKFGGDLLAHPELRRVLLDGNLVEIASQILGSREIVYSGDSSATLNSNQHGWHKDNTDRNDAKAPDWQTDRYPILRFGVYLQDHTKHTLGLNLRARSHNLVNTTEGKNIYVRTRVGDVAVWSLRISHSGNGTLLKFPRWYAPDLDKDGKFPSWLIAPRDGDRMALFAALGTDHPLHDRYVDYLKTRTYIVNMWRRSAYDDEARRQAEKIGLTIRDLPAEVQGDPNVGKNEQWQPTPY